MKAQIKLEGGKLTLNVDGQWMEVTNTDNGEYVCGVSGANMGFIQGYEKQHTRRLFSVIQIKLLQLGYLEASHEVRDIIYKNEF